jgi:hypothetical protein
MAEKNVHLRIRLAFERKFGVADAVEFVNLDDHRLIRVLNPANGSWADYDTTAWRIRAVAWNGPDPR